MNKTQGGEDQSRYLMFPASFTSFCRDDPFDSESAVRVLSKSQRR